jgi:hypothetical protein
VARLLLFAFTIVCSISSAQSQDLSPQQLESRAIERRAIESVIWGMPAVNAELMFRAMKDAKADFNQVVYWSRPLTWKNQTLTPNPDTIYLMPFYDTAEAGPMVLEIPPADADHSITGSVDDAWQVALEDVGPAGVDKGAGAKYLIVPPGYKETPPDGYVILPSPTLTGFALLRSNLKSGSKADVASAVAYSKRIKFYPLSKAASPPETVFVDAIDTLSDSTIPYDLRFFQALDSFVQREPWLERDKVMMDTLASIGIEKGKPFQPDAATQAVLAAAANEAHAYLDLKYQAVFSPPFNDGKHWALPASPAVAEGMMTNFAKAYPVEDRAVTYSMVFFSAKQIGTGQYYLMTIVDSQGKPFDGSAVYKLNIPANVPMKLYWSVTVYDRVTHALTREAKWFSRASTTPGLVTNTDGSVDVFFGPSAPEGKEANWVPTKAGNGFEVLFRIYGPEKPFFDKTWVLPDIEKIN